MIEFPKNPESTLTQLVTDRIERESTWDKINLFLRGYQWLRPWSKGNSAWKRVNQEKSSRLYVTVNKMIAYHRAALARLMMTFPGVSVLPASHSQEDILKAVTSSQILRHYWFEAGLAVEGFAGARYLVNYGSYALHTYYQPDEGEDVKKTTGDGKVVTEAISPYDWFLEQGSENLKEAQYIVLRSHVTKHELLHDYPEHKKKITVLQPKDKDRGTVRRDKAREIDRFEKLEWYFKGGGHGISVGDFWLEKDEKYFDKRFFPVQVIYYTEMDSAPYGMGVMEPLLTLQWLYNKSRTRVARNMEKMGHAKLMVPNGCKISIKDWDDTAGGIVPYNASAGKPWVWAPSVNIGQEVDQSMRISAEMDDSAGIHAVSRGKQVPGMRSAVAIDSLSEKDNTDMLPTIHQVEEAYRLCFQIVLHLQKKHYKKDKMLRMWDSFGSAIFKTINETKIVDEPDIFIEVGSMFRDGQTKRRADILELFQLGLISPEEASEALSMNVGLNNRLMRKIQGLRKALDVLEHLKTETGPVRFFATDDFKSLQMVLEEFMASEEFNELGEDMQEYIGNIMSMIATQLMDPAKLEALQALRPGQAVQPQGQGAPGMMPPQAIGPNASPGGIEGQEAIMAQRQNASPIGKAF